MGLMKEYEGTEVADLAARVDELSELYNSGSLTKEEYSELLEDLQRESAVLEQCSDMQLKANILKSINLLSKLI